ncbi:unnamed protein product, partial [Iphiclides podalirius]
MGSKKHKKESKKKKHRSRSRSPLDVEERERKRHKKHKDRKKDRSPDVEEVPVDSHLQKDTNGAAHSKSRSGTRSHSPTPEPRHVTKEKAKEKEQSPVAGGGAQESLSIEETNRLRAKLGLKPLEVAEKPAEDGKIKDDLGEFYHKPATNIAQQKKADKLREKLEERREKRKLEQKLQTTLLADESDDEDAIAWVKKSREIEQQKKEAEKRAAMLDEMDAVFGVSALVEEEQAAERQASYGATHLKGLRVAHDIEALGEEREVVLTLADKPVLAEDPEDVLVNVNMLDDERYRKNVEERKKARAGYQAYDEEAELQAALGFQRPVLAKYDEVLAEGGGAPPAHAAQRGFHIGDDEAVSRRLQDLLRQEQMLQGGPERRLESLQTALRPATDYLDEHEIQAKFKKPKRKGKIRKKAKEEPIDVDDYEAGTVPLDTDDTDVKPDELKMEIAMDDEEVEPDSELQAALARARRLRQAEERHLRVPKVEELLERVKEEQHEEMDAGAMVLDATAEFCRTLGDIPTYGLAGNRDHHAEIMELEREEMEVERAEEAAGAWSRVDVHNDRPPDLAAGSSVALDAEPALGGGVAGALQLALSKGYLERAGGAPAPRPPPHQLAARHYSIEDKSHGEEEGREGREGRHARRERAHAGPLLEFRERAGFRPHVKLDYVDDEGRPLCPKEAFRYLSHKFHGKGPGKNKQEKRIKKAVQEGLMKKMSSTDTPLGTLQMLQEKQRETHSPYVVLSGAKREHK